MQTRYQAVTIISADKRTNNSFVSQVIKDADWVEGEDIIKASEKNMIYDKLVHKKYNAEYYYQHGKKEKRQERPLRPFV